MSRRERKSCHAGSGSHVEPGAVVLHWRRWARRHDFGHIDPAAMFSQVGICAELGSPYYVS